MTIEVTIENKKLVIFPIFYLVAVIPKISLALSQNNKMFRKSIVLLINLSQLVSKFSLFLLLVISNLK